jgi:hypothetical protein
MGFLGHRPSRSSREIAADFSVLRQRRFDSVLRAIENEIELQLIPTYLPHR